eukprot:CAMPEP_0178455710 /NCGR_PEP_ID=MMETSP0689_2-20121128/46057_1 /TAXON_ID=160604 /ORGANISM="Amphidinium massartii, Strain CS-259" /LENGTH=30 /DNA_ID= /DNA_START= /DNA_END= /DNA_ORIENTATION=
MRNVLNETSEAQGSLMFSQHEKTAFPLVKL